MPTRTCALCSVYKTRESTASRDDFYMGTRLDVSKSLSLPFSFTHCLWFDESDRQVYHTAVTVNREVSDDEGGQQQRKGELKVEHRDPVRNMDVTLEADYLLKASEQRAELTLTQKLADAQQRPWHLLAKNKVTRVAGDLAALSSTLEFGRDDQVILVSHALERDPQPNESEPDVEQDVRWGLRATQYTDWIEIQVPASTPRKYNITTAIRVGPRGLAERSLHLFSSIVGGADGKSPLYAMRLLLAPSSAQPALHVDVRRKPTIAPRLDDELSQLPRDTDAEQLYVLHYERAFPSRQQFSAEEGAAGVSLGLIVDKKVSLGFTSTALVSLRLVAFLFSIISFVQFFVFTLCRICALPMRE